MNILIWEVETASAEAFLTLFRIPVGCGLSLTKIAQLCARLPDKYLRDTILFDIPARGYTVSDMMGAAGRS
jgi:hypothetical protein